MRENDTPAAQENNTKNLSPERPVQLPISFPGWKEKAVNDSDPLSYTQNKDPKKQKQIKLTDITVDQGVQIREFLKKKDVINYSEHMKEGINFPPITVFCDGNHYFLADGFHRVAAAKLANMDFILAEVRTGTRVEAKLHAAIANNSHGIKLTNAEKRQAAVRLLSDPTWRQWSNSEIARKSGLTHTFIGTVRKELFPDDSAVRLTKGGRKMDTRKIGGKGKKKSTGKKVKSVTSDPEKSDDLSPSGIKKPEPFNAIKAILGQSENEIQDPMPKLREENDELKAEIERIKSEVHLCRKEYALLRQNCFDAVDGIDDIGPNEYEIYDVSAAK